MSSADISLKNFQDHADETPHLLKQKPKEWPSLAFFRALHSLLLH